MQCSFMSGAPKFGKKTQIKHDTKKVITELERYKMPDKCHAPPVDEIYIHAIDPVLPGAIAAAARRAAVLASTSAARLVAATAGAVRAAPAALGTRRTPCTCTGRS